MEEHHHRAYSVFVWAGVLVCCGLLSGFTCFVQVKHRGLSHHETAYLDALRGEQLASLPGLSFDIYPLSHAMALNAADAFARLGVPRGPGLALLVIRLAQNALLFFLFVIYCRARGISVYLALLGASALAWALPHSYGDGSLRIPLYTDYVLYLALAIAVMHRWRLAARVGLALLVANLSTVAVVVRVAWLGVAALPDTVTMPAIVGTLGILPLLVLATISRWPRALRMQLPILLLPALVLRASPAYALIPLLALAVIPGVLWVMQCEWAARGALAEGEAA